MGDWQLDRLPDEVRQNAEYAARRDGLPLHRWLGRLIRDTCAEEGVPPSRELLTILGSEPVTTRPRHPAAAASRPAFLPIVVVPGRGATERPERPPMVERNGLARDGGGNDAAKARAVVTTPSSEPRRQTSPQPRHPTLARESMPPATSPIAPRALRLWGRAAPQGPSSILGAALPPALIAAPRAMPPAVIKPVAPPQHGFADKPPPAPPQLRVAAATMPRSAISFPLVASRSDDRMAALSTLVQRLRRNELSPIAEARQFVKLISEHRASISDIALATGRTEEQVARSLRLLSLPDKERDLIDRGALSRAAAFLLLDDGGLAPANPIAPARTRTP
jgi:hypothetical protein